MRLSDIIGLAGSYLCLGLVVAGILGGIYLCWYYLYFKKKWPDKKLNRKKLIGWWIFIIYLVVVIGATMLSRGGFFGNTRIYPLFYSYRDAWTDFSITEWRNIILNIGMFVPFGFFLPCLIKKTAAFWKVSVIGFLFTFSIELVQLLSKRGVFEPDDLLGNTVGAMIGYGVYCLVTYLVRKRKKEETPKIYAVLLCQLPLVLVIGAFSTIFLVYHTKELGNMPSACIMKQKNIEVSGKTDYSETVGEVMVYKASVMKPDETRELASDIFGRLGCEIDEGRTDIYENTAIFYSQGDGDNQNRYSIWVEYDGEVFRFTDFEKNFGESDTRPKEDASEKEVKEALEKMGVYVPKEVSFEKGNEGEYVFSADKLKSDGKMYDGYIRCTYFEDGTIGSVNYELLTPDEYKTVEIMSEAEAYEQIQEGNFNYFRAGDAVLEIELTGVKLNYELDTKGFYQPVYLFEGTANGYEMQIAIPAIK